MAFKFKSAGSSKPKPAFRPPHSLSGGSGGGFAGGGGSVGPQGPPGPPGIGVLRADPVYVEDSIAGWANATSSDRTSIKATAGALRTAIIAALAANPNARVFVLPSGAWAWDKTQYMNEAHGLRNNLTFIGQDTEIYCDVAGATTGQVIFFMWNYNFGGVTAGQPKHDIHFRGIKFSLLNANTSYFSLAISIECATKCSVVDCEFYCTFSAGAAETKGKQRWGFGIFGDSISPTNGGGRDNYTRNILLTNSQFQGCGAGRSMRNCIYDGFSVNTANDLAVSVCTIGNANKLENIIIRNVQVYDVAGSGVLLVGGDGNTAGEGVGVIRNILIDGVQGAGSRTPDLDFRYQGMISFFGGIITENIQIKNVGNRLDSNTSGTASFCLNIGGSPDQIAAGDWTGLTVDGCDFSTFHDSDPKQQIVVACLGIDGVKLSKITCKGSRGIQLQNCDRLILDSVTCDNGTVEIIVDRNLTSVTVANCSIARTSSFLYGLWFRTTSSNKNVASALISNSYLRGHSQPGLEVALNGGTMSMQTSNVDVTGTLSSETLTGIKCSSSSPGILRDRASFGSGKGYVDVVIDLAAQTAGSVAEISTAVTGSLAGDAFAISTLTAIDSTIMFGDARCRVDGTVVWRLLNISGTPNPSSNTFRFALVSRN